MVFRSSWVSFQCFCRNVLWHLNLNVLLQWDRLPACHLAIDSLPAYPTNGSSDPNATSIIMTTNDGPTQELFADGTVSGEGKWTTYDKSGSVKQRKTFKPKVKRSD